VRPDTESIISSADESRSDGGDKRSTVTIQRPYAVSNGPLSDGKRLERTPDLEAAGTAASLTSCVVGNATSGEATDSLSSRTGKNVEIIAALENAATLNAVEQTKSPT